MRLSRIASERNFGCNHNISIILSFLFPAMCILSVFISYADASDTVYVATAGALSISADGGNTFANKTSANGLGSNAVRGVYVAGSTVYAATVGGVSVSMDRGNTFANKTTADGLGHTIVYAVYAVGSSVYAATAGGLSVSADGGDTFLNKTTADGLGDNTVYGVCAVGSSVYAATAKGLSVSADGGNTFSNKIEGLGDNTVYGVHVVGSTVYAATAKGLSISADGGNTFINKTVASGLGHHRVNGVYAFNSTIYAATSGGLSVSSDGGNTFVNKTTADGLGGNHLNSVYAIGSTVYAAAIGGVSVSHDGGNTFINKATCDGLGSNAVFGVFAVSGSSAVSGVSVTNVGSSGASSVIAYGTAFGTAIAERGFFWWTDSGFTSGTVPASGSGSGDFSLILTNLQPKTVYYISAYIRSGGNLITSANKLLFTTNTDSVPVVHTDCNASVNGYDVLLKGEITDIGGSPVKMYGFVYALHPNPTIWDMALPFTGDMTLPISQGKPFEGTLRNLSAGKYYFRAYAHNNAGTAYGEEFTFTVSSGGTGDDVPGDLNGDGDVNLDDAMIAMKILVGIPVDTLNLNADMNQDGRIAYEEALFVLQKTAEIR